MPEALPRPTDVVDLEGFPLAWRWTDPKHHQLAPEELRVIRPLSATAAYALAGEAARRFTPAPVSAYDLSICAEWDEVESVRARLATLPVPSDTDVVVHWDPSTAVWTTWGLFVQHWDAFCYPSSDDVVVWAPGQQWTLCYRHFELIQFQASERGAA